MAEIINSDPPSPNNNPASQKFWQDILTDVLQELMLASNNFNAPCKQILEGMRDAVIAHDNLGAARAYESYLKCMGRPAPLRNVPTP